MTPDGQGCPWKSYISIWEKALVQSLKLGLPNIFLHFTNTHTYTTAYNTNKNFLKPLKKFSNRLITFIINLTHTYNKLLL